MKTVCALNGCPTLTESTGGNDYCPEHLGAGAIIDAIDNLGGYVDQVAGQLDRVARLLEDKD